MGHFEQYFLQNVSNFHHPYSPNSYHHKSKGSPNYLLVFWVLITPMHLSQSYLETNYGHNYLQLKSHQNFKRLTTFYTVQSM